MKLYIDPNVYAIRRNNFEQYNLVEDWKDCDVAIFQSTIEPNLQKEKISLNKVIYISMEPPLADHRLKCYGNKDRFLAFVGWDEEDEGNRIKISNEPQYFPWQIVPWQYTYKNIETSKKNQGIFYLGMVNWFENVKDQFGGENITKTRRIIGTYFHENVPGSDIKGIGWPWSNKRTESEEDWQIDKLNRIASSEASFVLAIENVRLRNHITEKIQHGLISNKVTLYLGCPNIEQFIPTNCFVDLRRWYNPETKDFDCEGLHEYLKNMTEEEYQEIVENARRHVLGELDRHHYFENLDILENKIKGVLDVQPE